MVTAWIGSFTFIIPMILYILLLLGYPLGEYAMGGKYRVIPKEMKGIFIVSIIIQLFTIIVLLQLGGIINAGIQMKFAKGFGWFMTFYLTINTVMNALSKSKKEKLVATPLSAITVVCIFWTLLSM